MAVGTWISFFIFALIIAISPGPGCILTINHALRHGWKPTLSLIFGQEVAVFVMMIVATTTAGMLTRWNGMMLCIKVVGVSWLIFSAWNAWRASCSEIAATSIPVASKMDRFFRGFITDITNGKAAAFLVAMIPGYLSLDYPIWSQSLLMTSTMVGIDTMVLLFYSILCGRLRLMFKNPNFFKIQNRVSAIVLLLLAGRLAM